MELRMNFVSLIKLKDAIKINDINGEIIDYHITDNEINGVLGVNGKYLKNDLDKVYTFTEEVPFNIVFFESNFELDDLDCIDLNYDLVEGRGIELSFDIRVEYNISDDEDEQEITIPIEDENKIIEELPNEFITDDYEINCSKEPNEKNNEEEIIYENNEKILFSEIEDEKENITDEITNKLSNYLTLKDDNLPQDKEILSIGEEKRAKIKVCYFKNDNDLEEICRNNNIPIDQLFKSNINNDINKHRRVILK